MRTLAADVRYGLRTLLRTPSFTIAVVAVLALGTGAVGADFFDVVRPKPSLGRVFLPEEDTPAQRRVVILSDAFWKSHLGGAADVIGRTLMLDSETYTIVGVMPPQFSIAAWG